VKIKALEMNLDRHSKEDQRTEPGKMMLMVAGLDKY
jgi:hypothetical protein